MTKKRAFTGNSLLRKVMCVLLLSLVSTLSFAQFAPDSTYFGTNDYIEYRAGNLPIIISAPHGGYLTPANIPDRNCSGCTYGMDLLTQEVAKEIDTSLQVVFGGRPHIIVCRLSRSKLDANREIVEAAQGNPDAELAWAEYHDFIQAAKDSCIAQYGSAIYIDLHGHGHPIQRVELGYLLNKTELQLTDNSLDAMNFQDTSSIKHLKNVLNPTESFSDLLRGNECIGEFLVDYGYPAVPSASDPAPNPSDPFFQGGYNTRRHGSSDSSDINGIQFELNYSGVRNTNANRNAFSRALACVLRDYLDRWFFDLEAWDLGNVVNNTNDSGPGSLRSALLGADDGTIITFAPTLLGDTIQLEKELQICSDVTIQGPGSGMLAVSGENTTRILRIMQGSTVEISGLSLVNGNAPTGEDGGAVLSRGNVLLTNCRLANNYASDDGGAVATIDSLGFIELDSCVVINNSCGDDGGAIRCLDGTVILNSTTVQSNTSPSFGGAISANGTVKIDNCTFSQNQCTSSGGAIRTFGSSTLDCENSTFENNSAGSNGGGISSSATTTFNFCTIMNNSAGGSGGGIQLASTASSTIGSTLIAENSSGSGSDISATAGTITSEGFNLVGDETGGSWPPTSSDQLGTSLAPIDPMVLPLNSNGGFTQTIALQPGSPCVDEGNLAGAPPFDQRGNIRVSGSQPDIGAFELCIPTNSVDVQTACESYTWIDGNVYTSNNNSATFILPNAGGCDSLVTLNLTINTVDTSINYLGNTLSANVSGVTYQWLDCLNSMQIIPGETSQTYSPTVVGEYAVEITQNGCTDTSSCYLVTDLGIIENDFGEELLLYPNPTEGDFSIDLGAVYDKIEITITDLKGKLIQSDTFEMSQLVNLSFNEPAGIYLVTLNAGGKSAKIQLVKTK